MRIFNLSALHWMQRILTVTLILVLPVSGEPADDDGAPVEELKAVVPAMRRLVILEQQVTQQKFEQLVFGPGQDERQVREKLGRFLSERIWMLDVRCKLSDDQRQKLLLAGRGDIKRVFDRVNRLKNDYESPALTVARRQQAGQDAFQLKSVVNSGYSVFGSESLLTKAIRHVLTDDQRVNYDELRLTRYAAPSIQPNRISFGVIRAGAIVEASCRVTTAPTMSGNVDVQVNAPAFIQTVQKRVELHNWNGWGRPAVCDVNVLLRTSTVGEFEGTIRILIGDEWFAEIPVTATIVADEPGLHRILMVDGPFNEFSANDASSLEAWREFVRSAKLDANYLAIRNGVPALRELDLSRFNVIVMGESGLLSVNQHDRKRLKDYVDAGGRLMVTTNSEFRGTAEKVNQFLSPYGLMIEDKEIPSKRFDVVDCLKMADHPFTKNVGKLTFIGPSVISVNNAKDGLILVDAPRFPGSGYGVMAKIGQGSIVVLGSSACWTWIVSDNNSGSNNATFLKNLICEP